MANKYTLGSGVAIPMTFTVLVLDETFVARYVPYDPALPTLVIMHPDGVTTDTYTFPASAQILRPPNPANTGRYYGVILPNATGTWKWEWRDPSLDKPGVLDGSFSVSPRKIT